MKMRKDIKILNIKKNDVYFKIMPNDNDKIFWNDFQNNQWERNFFETFIKIKNINNYIFIDIGASNGCCSLYAASFCKKVFSLEPDKKTYEVLKKNVELNNKNIIPLNLALSTKNKKIPSIPGQDFSDIMFSNNQKIFLIKTINFPQLLKRYIKKEKFFLKIDIEGYEFSLLNNDVFQSIIKLKKPPIYLAIHIGAGPLFKYKKAPFKFLQRFYNLHKTFLEYKLLYKLLNNYKKIEIDGVLSSRLFFFNPLYYRRGVNIFMYNIK